MITVTAAIIEKDGLILAARRKPGSHLAGYWEFPGGKQEPGETEHECLARELEEEFGISCTINEFFAESIWKYHTKRVKLRCYRVQHLGGCFQCRDHDRIRWLPVKELPTLKWAPADISLVEKLVEEWQVAKTFHYYQKNADAYTEETVGFNSHETCRQRFFELLAPNSLILDLGCGSGRDSRFFLENGHRVVAVDAVKEVADCAARYLTHPVRVQKAEDLSEIDCYDGIWAAASLLHIPESRIIAVFCNIIRALKPGGVWYMSFKSGVKDAPETRQRFFSYYSLPRMRQLLDQVPQARIIDLNESSSLLRGKKQQWLNVLVMKN